MTQLNASSLEFVSADLTVIWFRRTAAHPTPFYFSLIMPRKAKRKAAPKVAEDGEPVEAQALRRSARIAAQPHPATLRRSARIASQPKPTTLRRSARIAAQPKPAKEPAKLPKKPAASRKERNAEKADTQEGSSPGESAKEVGIFPPYNVSWTLTFDAFV
jgi:hypothetical protein